MWHDLKRFVQAIVRWLSVISITCFAILMLGRGSCHCCMVVDVGCLCRLASAFKWIVHFFTVMKRLNNRRTFRSLGDIVLGSCYQSLVRQLSSAVVLFVTFISPSTSITGRMTAKLSFVNVGMPEEYFLGLHKIKLFAVPVSYRPSHHVETLSWWQELEGSRLLCVPTPVVFAYCSGYILRHNPLPDLVWRIGTSEFVRYSFISFLGLAWAGTNASASGNSFVLSVRKVFLCSFLLVIVVTLSSIMYSNYCMTSAMI